MKQLYTLIAALLITTSVLAQAPEKMSYQAVVRDDNNNLVANQAIGLKAVPPGLFATAYPAERAKRLQSPSIKLSKL